MAVALATLGSARVAGQTPNSNELLVAMRSGSAELVNQERSTTSYKCRTVMAQKQRVLSERELRVWRSGESILVETDNGGKRGGLNADYMFGVERSKQGEQWKLVQFANTERIREFDQTLGQLQHVMFPLTAVGTSGTLQEWIDNPKFRVTATRLRPDGAAEADFSTEQTTPRGVVALTGTITVSAKQRGLVLAYQHTTSSGPKSVKFTMTRQVDEVGSGFQCKSLTFALADPKTGDVFQNGRAEFGDYGVNPIDRAEFYLSHYGLPEPPGVVPPSNRTPRYVWLLIAAGSFAVLAVLFRWQARRWRSAPATPTTAPPTVN
jgi:hypothetical protein